MHAQGDPYLGQDGIAGRAQERFDLQVLVDPLEKELDLPTLFVNLCDLLGFQVGLAGGPADAGTVPRRSRSLCNLKSILALCGQEMRPEAGWCRCQCQAGLRNNLEFRSWSIVSCRVTPNYSNAGYSTEVWSFTINTFPGTKYLLENLVINFRCSVLASSHPPFRCYREYLCSIFHTLPCCN